MLLVNPKTYDSQTDTPTIEEVPIDYILLQPLNVKEKIMHKVNILLSVSAYEAVE